MARGPHGWVTPFDRAKIIGVPFTVQRLQQATKAKNDIVAIVTAERGVQVGRVVSFLQHIPVGTSPVSFPVDEKEKIAHVEWFAQVPDGQAFVVDKELPRPCVASRVSNDSSGIFWQCEGLLPINIGVAQKVKADGGLTGNVLQVLQRDTLAFERQH